MALNSSGKISLAGSTTGESIAVELGLGAESQIALNDTSVRTLLAKSSGEIALSDAYGKANQFSATISSTQLELNLRTWALSNGWDGSTKAVITIDSGVYIYSNNTATPALTISGSWPNGIDLINNGFIMGKGGDSAAAGGPAISLGISVTIDNTNSSAYVGGGGGGGGFSTLGGGGAGGGKGDPAVGTAGNNGAAAVGGGGGRIFAGTGGAGTSTAAANIGGGGGGAGGGGGKSYTSSYTHRPTVFACSYVTTTGGFGGGGGGGWGASGGVGRGSSASAAGGAGGSANSVGADAVNGGNYYSGGAGGKAVVLNGYSVTWISGDTARVYGSVS